VLHFRFEPPRALMMRFIWEAASQSHDPLAICALWLGMQIALDLWEAERDEDVKKVKPLPAA
jgi:hypothetical protein